MRFNWIELYWIQVRKNWIIWSLLQRNPRRNRPLQTAIINPTDLQTTIVRISPHFSLIALNTISSSFSYFSPNYSTDIPLRVRCAKFIAAFYETSWQVGSLKGSHWRSSHTAIISPSPWRHWLALQARRTIQRSAPAESVAIFLYVRFLWIYCPTGSFSFPYFCMLLTSQLTSDDSMLIWVHAQNVILAVWFPFSGTFYSFVVRHGCLKIMNDIEKRTSLSIQLILTINFKYGFYFFLIWISKDF